MSELKPELRPDKNGHMVTRWVRKDSSAGTGRSIPKVGASPKDKLEARRKRTVTKMVKLLVIHSYNFKANDARMFLNETVGKYTNVNSFNVIDAALARDPQYIIDAELITSDYPEDQARDMIHFAEFRRDDVREEDCNAAILGLKGYAEFSGVDDLSALKGREHDKAVALLKTGLQVIASDPDYRDGIGNSSAIKEFHSQNDFRVPAINGDRWRITDQSLVDVVLSNVDRLDDIMEIMSARKVFDGEIIQQYLNEHSALNKGVL
jgi:hypothetical protein